MKVLLLMACLLFLVTCQNPYDNPGNWGGVCNLTTSTRQSPINIVTDDVNFCPWVIDFGMEGYCQEFNHTIGGSYDN